MVIPIISFYASRMTIAKRILQISSISSIIILIAAFTGISTRSSELDCFLIFSLYCFLLILLFYFYPSKNIIVKIIIRVSLAISLAVGYLLASLGIIILILIVQSFKPDRTVELQEGYALKQYNLGYATESYRGTKISIVKRPFWLPGLEYDVFSKTYDRKYSSQFIPADPKKHPTLYSDDFEVKYNSSSKTIILMDTITRDTINLK